MRGFFPHERGERALHSVALGPRTDGLWVPSSAESPGWRLEGGR